MKQHDSPTIQDVEIVFLACVDLCCAVHLHLAWSAASAVAQVSVALHAKMVLTSTVLLQ